MAIRDELISAGLEDAQAKIAEAVLKSYISGEYVPKHRFDEVNTKNKELSQSLAESESKRQDAEKRAKEAEDQISPLQEEISKTYSEWEQKYTDLQKKHEQEEEDRRVLAEYQSKVGAIAKFLGDSAYDKEMVSSLIDLNSLKLENGNVSGVKEAVERIRKEKPFLFKPEETVESTAPVSAPKKQAEKVNFGELLAKKAEQIDAQTAEATKKYFG